MCVDVWARGCAWAGGGGPPPAPAFTLPPHPVSLVSQGMNDVELQRLLGMAIRAMAPQLAAYIPPPPTSPPGDATGGAGVSVGAAGADVGGDAAVGAVGADGVGGAGGGGGGGGGSGPLSVGIISEYMFEHSIGKMMAELTRHLTGHPKGIEVHLFDTIEQGDR